MLTRDQQAEVDAQRAGTQATRRATVAALEEILYQPIAVLDHGFVRVIDYMGDDAGRAYAHYLEMLNERPEGGIADPARDGLARELARMNLSLGFYTQWYWKIDLHNLLHFLSLRADPHAQHEIRAYAAAMLDTVQRWVPLAHGAFVQHRLEAVTLSAAAWATVRRMLGGETVTVENSGLGKREWRELMAALGRD